MSLLIFDSTNIGCLVFQTACVRPPLPRLRRRRELPTMLSCATSAKWFSESRNTACPNRLNSTDITEQLPKLLPPVEPPVVCCGSGCQNCVWIQYAEDLASRYQDGGQKAMDAIERIDDPVLRSFLLAEIAMHKRRK